MAEINQMETPGIVAGETAPAERDAKRGGKRIVLTTFGSFGDLHPYIAVGRELKSRGHRVVVATSPLYREKIEATGLGFHPVRPDIAPPEENPEVVKKIMDLRTGGRYIIKELFARPVRESYEDLLAATRDADLLITHIITYAGPIVAQKTGVPWISSVLAPTSFFSIYDPFVPPQAPGIAKLLRLSPALGHPFIAVAKRVTDSWVAEIYKLRAEVGLPRGQHPVFEGQHSPSLVLALFSKVLSKPQPDWPKRVVVTGFPFYDRRDETDISPELLQFLDSGPAPIVFTLGSSAIFVAEDFYRVSVEAARRLKRRAVLLIGEERNRPKEPLPEGVVAFDYAPFGQILPRAAAIVHQGGVGTTGQALRAGVPTLIVPFNHDQPDNASRVERLGTSRTLRRRSYTAERAARELERLLTDETYARRAAEIGQMVRSEDGARTAADEIEKFIESRKRCDK